MEDDYALDFKKIPSNLGTTLWRAEIPGGWLMMACDDVVHVTEQQGMQSGYDYRSSLTFVSDPEHLWR